MHHPARRMPTELPDIEPLRDSTLPDGVRARRLRDVNGLDVHLLEAGWQDPDRPLVLLLHGFPELAYSLRRVLPALAAAGYHAVAPDQRGYGRTTGWDPDFDTDLAPYGFLNLVHDALGVVWTLGRTAVHAVVGHDFGSPVAAWCGLIRPDVFQRVVLMSAPFARSPAVPGTASAARPADLDADLAALKPPRRHYHTFYSTRPANDDMWRCPQGVHDFLRGYFHYKSADWPGNEPHPLAARSAEVLAKLPTYYVMRRDEGMAATAAAQMPSAEQIAGCAWLPDAELAVYAQEYGRTGFQGGLNWYRARTAGVDAATLQVFAGRTIDVPALFIAGRQDWGVFQTPGAFESMQHDACRDLRGCHLVDGAGHWVQQEQHEAVNGLLLEFLG